MPLSFADAVEAVHGLLGASAVLRQLGYAAYSCDLSDETPTQPAKCRFLLHPSVGRHLAIDFCWSRSGDHFFVVEVFNTPTADSFLLDEWLSRLGVGLDPYPFVVSSYAGSERERLAGFISFLGQHLSSARLADVLAGREWEHIPFNWGALK